MLSIGTPTDRLFGRLGLPVYCDDPSAFVPLRQGWALFDAETSAEARVKPMVAEADVLQPTIIDGSRKEPVYPELPRLAGLEAEVVLQGTVTTEGTVEDLCVVSVDIPNMGFEWSALEAAQSWRYRPAELNGLPIALPLKVIVKFNLTEPSQQEDADPE